MNNLHHFNYKTDLNNVMRTKPGRFHLDKWYLDCVTGAGNTAICYSATLAWKQISLSYASSLTFNENSPEQRTSLLDAKRPEQTPEGIVWESDGLSCRGLWRPCSQGIDQVLLYEGEEGSVQWHCLQPLSLAELNIGSDLFTGLGYVERLEMTVVPWKLPIHELLWGRFLSDDMYLVWIQWKGPSPLTRLFFNGHVIENADISADHVRWDSGNLIIANNAALRDGPIISKALSKMPGLSALVPDLFRKAYECKWRGRGELRHGDAIHKGWVIHEIVRFR